jgi:flagellar protein FlgJ
MLRADLAAGAWPGTDFDLGDTPVAGADLGATASGASEGAADFGGVFAQVRSEVDDFLQNGGGAPAWTGAMGPALAPAGASTSSQVSQASAAGTSDAGTSPAQQQAFLASVQPWAEEAGRRLDVSPRILAAQAALESGWGKHPLRGADGADSHNLFGIKAGPAWRADSVESATTEYDGDVPTAQVERFRAYPDAAGSFRDLADLVSGSPRYQGALHAGDDARAYAQGLKRGGYATDPAYADKLVRLATKVQGGGY